jgi:hypothetical protein
MKKILFLLILLPLLWGGLLSAQTVSNLAVMPGASGSPSTVTFDVEWTAATLPTPWLDSMWVFVDYNKNGKMERLLISGGTLTEHTATKAGTGIFIPENDMGAWVYGDARSAGNFSAKVELYTKETDIIIAGACAYASSYPPVGDWLSDSKLGFTGTPWYEITLEHTNGGTITVSSGGAFFLPCSYTVSSFTDRTGAPGMFNCIRPATHTLSGANVCEGEEVTLTLAGSESEWKYQLYNGSTPVGIVKDGGGVLTFEDTPASDGEYTYTVRTVGGNGVRCDMPVSTALNVTVNPEPKNLSLTASTATVCANQPVTLTALPAGAASYSIDGSTWQSSNIFSRSLAIATTYTLYVKTAAGCTATKADAATVTVIALPDAPTSPSSNVRCGNGTVTFSASVPVGHTIDWYTTWSGGTLVNGGSGTTSFSPSIYSTTIYHAQARNTATGCVSATRLPVTGTVNDTPYITYVTKDGEDYNKTVQRGGAMSPITYTAHNATGIFLYSGPLPDGITGSVDYYDNLVFVIKGTPTSSVSAGVYYYQVGATHTSCPSVVGTHSGWIEVITTPPAAKTTNTWTFGSQIWSDLIVAQPTNCTRVSFSLTSVDYPSPEYSVISSNEYYYNWVCVDAAQSVMCPSPWRVPTKSDFETLAGNTSFATLYSAWGSGGTFFAGSNHVDYEGFSQWLWSSESDYSIYKWLFITDGSINSSAQKHGFQVRCVKDS